MALKVSHVQTMILSLISASNFSLGRSGSSASCCGTARSLDLDPPAIAFLTVLLLVFVLVLPQCVLAEWQTAMDRLKWQLLQFALVEFVRYR